jgi:hypothetical protein
MPDGSSIHPAHPRPATRDVRLDFFRGIGMFIIFIAHVPRNPLNDWIPARFGFSDATEIFVFCSGMASAIAFASVFDRAGFVHGLARVLYRCWQVYWCHIGLFLSCATIMVAADQYFGTGSQFVNSLSIGSFFSDTRPALLGLFTLTYVPNLFDILPMYLVVLALIPVVMALSLLSGWAILLFCVLLWGLGWYGGLNLPAEPWGNRTWFFNPLAWQAIFFTGFAFMRGWLPAPPIDSRLVRLALAGVLLSMPFAHHWGIERLPDGFQVPNALIDKNNFGPLRYVHFLALAYLAYAAAGPGGANLRGPFVAICCKVGQQSLAVFIAGIVFSLMGGIALARTGYTIPIVTAVNLAGFGGLIAVAYTVAWFKSKPWAKRRMATSGAASSQSQAAE